jgi:type II secretory pathway component GspD/PulD (secretin)
MSLPNHPSPTDTMMTVSTYTSDGSVEYTIAFEKAVLNELYKALLDYSNGTMKTTALVKYYIKHKNFDVVTRQRCQLLAEALAKGESRTMDPDILNIVKTNEKEKVEKEKNEKEKVEKKEKKEKGQKGQKDAHKKNTSSASSKSSSYSSDSYSYYSEYYSE